ncbi:MAG: hypothetical protein ACOYON_08340 [Fimbriimonas sp.]
MNLAGAVSFAAGGLVHSCHLFGGLPSISSSLNLGRLGFAQGRIQVGLRVFVSPGTSHNEDEPEETKQR